MSATGVSFGVIASVGVSVSADASTNNFYMSTIAVSVNVSIGVK